MLETIFAELEKQMGLTALKGTGDQKDSFLLSIDEDREVWVKEQEGLYIFWTRVIPASENWTEDFFMTLMKANLLGQATGDSALALDAEEKYLTLIHKIEYEMNYPRFTEALESFINYAEYWKEETNKQNPGQISPT